MEEYTYLTYGEQIAEVYDEFYAEFDQDSVDLLFGYADGGRALELGIGTGRVALPLQKKGVKLHGIDVSDAMVSRLKAKPGGEDIEITKGSFDEIEIDKQFELIYVIFNTFYALLTQEEQVRCFRSVADHLKSGGVFLIEAFVPDLSRFDRNQTVRAVHLSEGQVRIDASTHNPLNQHIASQHILLSNDGVKLYPVKLRYAWPSEFDLMANLAGLTLKERWASWAKDSFSSESGKHISVYGK